MRWTAPQQLQGILHQGNHLYSYLIAAQYVMENMTVNVHAVVLMYTQLLLEQLEHYTVLYMVEQMRYSFSMGRILLTRKHFFDILKKNN